MNKILKSRKNIQNKFKVFFQSFKRGKNWRFSGQTLMEVVIALTIFSVVITGIIILAVNTMSLGYNARARMFAANAAQDAIDKVKNVRDNDPCEFFKKDGTNFVLAQNIDRTWRLDPTGTEVLTPSWSFITPGSSILRINRNIAVEEPLFGPSQFFTDDGSYKDKDDYRKVTVTVSWEMKGVPGQQHIRLVTYLSKNF